MSQHNSFQKLQGTTSLVFEIGINKGILDFSNLTSSRLLKFPDSNGSIGDVLTTDGAGNLNWTSISASTDSTTPYYIPPSTIFINNLYKQNLFTMPITVDGALEINGYLIEVD